VAHHGLHRISIPARAHLWFGWSKPEAGKDYRWQMFSALLSIEGLLLGVFLQEGRVQQKTQEVAEAQRVITTYSSQVNHEETAGH
jgi:hypothetical protein